VVKFGLLLTFLTLLGFTIGQYEIGVSVVDITASQEEIDTRRIFMGGYGVLGFRDGAIPKPAIGVHDPIWARSMYIGYDNNSVIITVLDTTGISNIVLDRMRQGAAAQIGISVDNILIGATHTHSGPDLQGLWGSITDSYMDFVVNGTIESIVNAYRTRTLARLFVSGAEGYANNRRGHGYTDTEIVVLDAIAISTGQRIGTLIQFAAHTTAIGRDNRLLSSDWAHYIRVTAESRLNAPVIYSNGAIGDVSPSLGAEPDPWDRANGYGSAIANLAVDSIPTQIAVREAIHLATAHFYLECTNALFRLAMVSGILDYNYEGGPIQGYRIFTRATYLRFGTEVQGCAFPGESLTRNAEPIKGAMQAKHKLFLGLNGDTLGYFVPSDEWNGGPGGGYEESISLSEEAGDFTRDQLIKLIQSDSNFP